MGAIDTLRLLYDEFVPGNETVMRELVEIVIELTAVGAAINELIKILSTDSAKEASLRPLILALLQEEGKAVRAPEELLKVAGDIRDRIQQRQS